MAPPYPYDPTGAPAFAGFQPNPFDAQAAYRTVQAKLRTASVVTMAAGALLFIMGFMFSIFSFVFASGAVGALFLVFGLVPGIVIIIAGAMMQRPGGSVGTWIWVTGIFGALSLLSFGGGILVPSILAFVGAGLARSALNAMPPFAPPPPAYAPAYPPYGAQNPPGVGYGAPPQPGYAGGPWQQPNPSRSPPPPVAYPPGAPPPYPPGAPAPTPVAPLPPAPEPSPWTPSVVDDFLAMDANRGFSLEALNTMDFEKLQKESVGATRKAEVAAKAQELRGRIEGDISDLDAIDDILRDRAVMWYRDSPGDPNWALTRTYQWAGLVSESHTAGGARTPALDERLRGLGQEPAASPPKRPFRPFRKAADGDAAPAGALAGSSSALPAQVVQAVLDDLAASPRAPGATLSLLRLAEVAAKATPAAVNQTLASLFKADARGPVVIIHPSRYPGFEFVIVRLPPPTAAGGAIAYDLLVAPPDAEAPAAIAVPSSAAPARIVASPVVDVSPAVWQQDDMEPAAWGQVLNELERRRDRLTVPPSNFRKLPAYFALRKLILGDENARRTFLAVKWRGKPPGVGLVAELLQEGSLVPEVETDGEYLEAELSDIERGDPEWRPQDNRWTLAQGLAVSRTEEGGAFTYRTA